MTSKTGVRYVVMTTSGKPVFVSPADTNETEENDTTRLCGIVQAMRVSIQQTLNQQDIHYLKTTQSTRVVWMTVQSFTWMVIVPVHRTESPLAYWKTQLERLYLAMIMMFTTQIHSLLNQNPQLDVESLWRQQSPEQLVYLRDDVSRQSIAGWGIPTCYLSSGTWRYELAASLIQFRNPSTPDPWMALVLARTKGGDPKLINYVASTAFPGFTTSDGALFWNWLKHQLSDEFANSQQPSNPKAIPLCFPHFHAGGYLYATWHVLSNPFTLVLLHQNEQINSFSMVDSLRIHFRQSSTFGEEFHSSQLEEQWLWEEYLDLSQAEHFLFRLHPSSTPFAQCIVSPEALLRKHLINNENYRDGMWRMYHQLCWQLRLGSTGVEPTLKHVRKIKNESVEHRQPINPSVASDCPMLQCMDAPPSVQGVTYITQGPTTYLAMSGRDFELYVYPEEVIGFGVQKLVSHPFRGCINDVKIFDDE
ncbi:hypothetical protein FisN_28Hh026 [Fistulifera solaris]|uniref:FUZ/MON1/HPS1 first Longin domain-containing protein n=1 Tax=Fistulifera solaris TaxID=1519565 RepID=A0A1Z5KH63_FISSO|nr:hypothetical protein FisN_28Hh026 [Fistulifera solaris]|eukprot:GAX25557.1 hypothetical protein FisN_28Hh026 [Fistulifera solaris]